MSTKSFIISLPIITGDQDRRRLRKSFSFGCNLQNAVMGCGWDRVLKMRATAEWQTARAMPKSSERTKAFRDLRVRFRLSEYDLGVSGFLCLGRLFQGQPNEAALCI